MNTTRNHDEMVNTTDSFEALRVFRTSKNLFFYITIICLLFLQTVFWLHHSEMIDMSGLDCPLGWTICPPDPTCNDCIETETPIINDTSEIAEAPNKLPTQDSAPQTIELPVVTDSEEATEALTENESEINQQAERVAETLSKQDEVEAMVLENETPEQSDTLAFIRDKILKWNYIFYLIKFANFFLIISVILYTLLLLICVQISLSAALGGIRHIAKAFMCAFIALIFLMPWQNFFPEVVAGAIYTPNDLFCSGALKTNTSLMIIVFYFLRFVVLWLIVILLLFSSQYRSHKWSKASLRRLGMH